MTTNKKNSHKLATGAGIATAAAVAAAGLYFFAGPKGAKNRKKTKGWALKAKKEALKELKKIEHIEEKDYHRAIDNAVKTYRSLKIDKKDIDHVAKELKSHWKNIKTEASKTKKGVKKAIAARKKPGNKLKPKSKRK